MCSHDTGLLPALLLGCTGSLTNPPHPHPLLPAYEDKQKQKRTEISSRSWFPSAKAGDALKLPGLGTKTSSSPAPCDHLGIVRRRPTDVSRGLASLGDATETPCALPTSPTAGPSGPPHSLVPDYSGSGSDSDGE